MLKLMGKKILMILLSKILFGLNLRLGMCDKYQISCAGPYELAHDHEINTHYYRNYSNLIWQTLLPRMDELISKDLVRWETSSVIRFYEIINEM